MTGEVLFWRSPDEDLPKRRTDASSVRHWQTDGASVLLVNFHLPIALRNAPRVTVPIN